MDNLGGLGVRPHFCSCLATWLPIKFTENFHAERNTECLAPSTLICSLSVETRLGIGLNDNSIFVESTFWSLEFSGCQGAEGDYME